MSVNGLTMEKNLARKLNKAVWECFYKIELIGNFMLIS